MSVVSGVTSAVMGADAAEDAAAAQERAARNATALQKYMYETSREDYAPWREAGTNAISALASKIAEGPGNYIESPGYDFRLAEGQKAIERSAAARGTVLDPATSKALIRYSQDYATNDYDNFLTRYYNSLTPFQSLAGLGMTAVGGTTQAGMNAANQMSQASLAAGNAQAAGYINSANAITGGMNSMANNAIAGYNAWRQYNSSPNYPTYDANNPIPSNVDSMGNPYGTQYAA
jgi:hypothetical protein